MTKSDVKQILKRCMKEQNFSVQNGRYYKIVEDNYLVGVWLDHSPYGEMYNIYYGVIFLPDETKMPFKGWCDWEDCFWFTKNPKDDISKYPLNRIDCTLPEGVDYRVEYAIWSEESFEKQLRENLQNRLSRVMDKHNVLELYKSNWSLFRGIPYETVEKIAGLLELDYDTIIRFRDG